MAKEATFRFKGVDNVSEALKTINDNVQKVTKATKNAAKSINTFNAALTVLKVTINGIVKVVSFALSTIIKLVQSALKTLKNIITGLFKFIKTALTTLLSWVTKALGKVFDGIKKLFSNIFSFTKSIVSKTIEIIKKGISLIIESVQKYADKQYNEIQLKVSLGDSYDQVMKDYKKLLRYTTADKNELLSVYATFAEVGKSPEEILKYSRATVYVANATGQSLDRIARLFLRQEAAGSDLEKILKKNGINISDQETSLKEIDRIIRDLGPEMEALATGSLAQAFANIRNDITAFKENLGQAFAGPVKKVADKIAEITQELSSKDLTNFADYIEGIFNRVWEKIEPIFDFIKLAIKYPEMLGEMKDALIEGGQDLVDGIKDYAKYALIWIGAFAFDVLRQAATQAFDTIKDPKFWDEIDNTIGTALNDIGAALNITGFTYSNQKLVKNADGSYSLPEGTSFAGYTDIKVEKNEDGTISIYDDQGKKLGNFTVDAKGYAHLVFDTLHIDYKNFTQDSEGRYVVNTPIYGYTDGIIFDSDNMKAYDMDGNPIEDLDIKLDGDTIRVTPKNGTMFKLILGENGGNISAEEKISIQDAVGNYWNAIKSVIEDSWNNKAIISLMPNLKLANPELSEQEILDKYMIDLIGDDASPWYRNLCSLLSGLWDGVIKPDIVDPFWDWIQGKEDYFAGLARFLGDLAATAFNNALVKSEVLRKILSALGMPFAVSSDQEYAMKAVSGIQKYADQGWVHASSAMEVLGSMSIEDFTPEFLKSKANVKQYKGTWLQYLLEFGGLLGEDYNHLNRLGRADYILERESYPNIADYLPHYAKGGLVTKPTIALIGEAGPELVIPNEEIPKLSTGDSPDHGIFKFNFESASDYATGVANGFVDLTKATNAVNKTTKKIGDIFNYYLDLYKQDSSKEEGNEEEELGFWAKLWNWTKTLPKKLGNGIVTMLKQADILKSFYSNAFGSNIGGIIGNIVNGFKNSTAENPFTIWNAFGEIIKAFLPYLEKGLEVVGSLFDEAFAILGNVVQILGERLGKMLLPILEAFIPLMKTFGDVLITLAPVVESILKPAILAITAILQILEPVLRVVVWAFMGIGAVIQTVSEAISWAIAKFINFIAGWIPGFKKLAVPEVHSVKENFNAMKSQWELAQATSTPTITTSTSTASQTASYNGASVIHIHNDFSGSYVVGTNGFRELALIIKNTLEDIDYSGQSV